MPQKDFFHDRKEAGIRLAEKLQPYADQPDVIVLGLPRGGVVVAYEVAKELNVPLDVFVVRKLGVPGHSELAMGAISPGGEFYLNDRIVEQLNISPDRINLVVASEKIELERREKRYRQGRPSLDVRDQRVILIDDGLATGASMRAAIRAVRDKGSKELIVAVPAVAASAIPEISALVDSFIYVLAPYEFYAVGQWYENFGQTTDEEVESLLSRSQDREFGNCRSYPSEEETRRPETD